jgi:leucyl-tRNA synthetase
MDFKEIEKKWQKKWEEARIFEAEPSEKEKFFVNVAYPYVNGYGHLGHMFTFLRGDIIARFKRMQGYNVLFAQGWHVTGQPIVAAAKRIREKESSQIEILKDMGFCEKEIEKFADPIEWVKFFPEKWILDFKNLGCSIDWRRTFITTSLNKPYDCFIKWQFKKLKERDYIKKGEHPVVYCDKCNFPIGDHDRAEGEGVVPEEIILLKFELKDEKIIVPVATYRPETIYGVTNLWVHPEGDYTKIKKNGEVWIVSREVVEDLRNQNFEVKELEKIKGKDLIKKKVVNLVTKDEVLILPAEFVDTKVGTGVVMSVPAHAPFDYAGIKELRENKNLREKYNIDEEDLKFEFISLIKLEGYGEFPAVEIVERMGIKSSKEKEKLEKATQEIYKKEFHNGIVKIDFLKGKKVREVKDKLINKFLEENVGVKYYILPEKVVCRCLNEGKVKIVKDQWFLNYSNIEWKEKAHQCIERMNYYPENVKDNFHYTVDWLNDWACTRDRKTSLGTALPFDENQVIESLSDSTIYMAYYTIAHYLQGGKLRSNKEVNDELFDYVFFGSGDKEKIAKDNGFDIETLEKMRKEFLYWYNNGFQIRNSGKDLIQNHLTFCIFNHVAIFPEINWPGGFSINGHVLLNGEKMSKSKGNVVLMKDAIKNYPVDILRFLVAYAGDSGLDDANIELRENKSIERRLRNFYEFAVSNYNKGCEKYRTVDRWFESVLNKTLKKVEKHYENLNTKSVLQQGFFELQNYFKWYRKRAVEFNKNIINKFIEIQLKILAPITPFICEELWEKLGNKGFISLAEWPKYDESKIDESIENIEKIISNLLEDIEVVIKLSKIEKPNRIKIILPEKWKYDLFLEIKRVAEKTKNFSELMNVAMKFEEARKRSKEIQKVIKRFLDGSLGIFDLKEIEAIKENKEFLERKFNCKVEFSEKQEKESWPGKFGIIVE